MIGYFKRLFKRLTEDEAYESKDFETVLKERLEQQRKNRDIQLHSDRQHEASIEINKLILKAENKSNKI